MTLFDTNQPTPAPVDPELEAKRERMRRSHEEAEARRASVEAGRVAQQQANAEAAETWKNAADAAILWVAERYYRFTSDDVWELAKLRTTHDNRALGPRMRAAANRGTISATNDFTLARRAEHHGSPARYWLSNVYDEGKARIDGDLQP